MINETARFLLQTFPIFGNKIICQITFNFKTNTYLHCGNPMQFRDINFYLYTYERQGNI
jgi:hypothetical protein